MSTFRVAAGDDFNRFATSSMSGDLFQLVWREGGARRLYLIKKHVVAMERLDESASHNIGGAVGGAGLGALVAGPVGAVAGAIVLGGQKNEVLFTATFTDGRKLIAICDQATWISALATFQAAKPEPGAEADTAPAWLMPLVSLLVLGPIVWAFVSCAGGS